MTAQTSAKVRKNPFVLAVLGASLLAVPLMMPSTAKADDFKIHLNLGGAPYYTPAAYYPPQRVVYRDYRPQRVVYVSRPVYRERVIVRNDYRRWRDHDNGHHGGKWDHRTAWR